jgi:hypothetical protein
MEMLKIAKANPSTNESTGLLQIPKVEAVQALFPQGAHRLLHHPVLLRACCDEFLLKAIAFSQCGVTPSVKYQVIARTKQ